MGGKGEVEGLRSPRWAVWKRMDIKDRYGETYLLRLRLIDTPWFGVYLHHIEDVDPQPDPHDHPWSFVSMVLAGGYEERVHVRWAAEPEGGHYVRRWLFGSVHRMKAEGVAHRIIETLPHTITLVLRGKRSREWGFWNMDDRGAVVGWTNWKDYEL